MSLLRRIQGSQPASSPSPNPEPARAPSAPEPPPTPSRRPLSTTGGIRDAYVDLKNRIQAKLLSELEPTLDFSRTDELRAMIEEKFDAVLMEDHIVLSRLERQRLFEQIVAEILGFGPLEPLLKDDTITEIMVNGPKKVYIERNGKIERTNVVFEDDEHLMRIIERIVAPLGRRVDESMPYVDARLPDGSRVNIVIPPISLIGPVVTIRKFYRTPLTVDDLIRLGSATPEVMEFLKACVQAKINIVVSGGTGSGKTTLLNILSGFIPEGERIITIENGRAAATPGACGHPGDPPAEHRGEGRDHHAGPGDQRPADAAGSHHRWGVPGWRGLRYAPGNEHRPRGVHDYHSRQQPARRPGSLGEHGADGRDRAPPSGDPGADRYGHRPHRPDRTDARWLPQDRLGHRDPGVGRGSDHHHGAVQVRAIRDGRRKDRWPPRAWRQPASGCPPRFSALGEGRGKPWPGRLTC